MIREGPKVFEEYIGKDAIALSEQAELNMIMIMLKCSFLEKKIKATQELKDIIERFSAAGDSKFKN